MPVRSAPHCAIPNPCRGFWQLGFEGSDHINGRGQPLSMPAQTGHVHRAAADYGQARLLRIATVRESLGWRESDLGDGRYDFRAADVLETRAREHGIQILWTLCHYGLPPGLHWFSEDLVPRFSMFCRAFATFLAREHPQPAARVYTPINEISFLAWAVCETGLMTPSPPGCAGQGYALKRRLVEASIAGMNQIWRVDPTARVLNVDPLIAVAPGQAGFEDAAARREGLQYQAWDMLAGIHAPELGGSARHLDLIGLNYYPSNQWEVPSEATLVWPTDARRVALHRLIERVWQRYRHPLLISETSHIGPEKGPWLHHVARAVRKATAAGIPLYGICLYPALNRPDWEDPAQWHDSGLWRTDALTLERSLDLSYAQALQGARTHLDPSLQDGLAMNPSPPTIVVFSHLRWDFVYQRPQHLLSRLARRFRVIFVQEPLAGEAALVESQPCAGVTVLQAMHPAGGHGFSDPVMAALSAQLGAYLARQQVHDYTAWFYTPMALPLLGDLTPQSIIYDCMDELSGFRNAPVQLMAREATLLAIANAVFTGGPSLQEAKRGRNARTECHPSSVDAQHFERARDPALEDPAYADVPHPRLGFYGVIDERLDIALVRTLAKRHPDWQLCLVGPIVKIDPDSLPVAANIHYFPQQAYDALPGALAAWDVCLLPFALNEATRFISPTKTLEYMCAGKPIVSTAIADVRTLYAEGAAIADDIDAFESACIAALAETPQDADRRRRTQARLVAGTSWDRTADAMAAIVEDTARAGPTPAARAYLAAPKVVPIDTGRSAANVTEQTPCLVVGAGPTGLAAAMHLGATSILVDANSAVGGWCRSIHQAGFTFDYAGHIMFSKDPYVLQLYTTLLGANLHWQDREAWIFSKNVYTRYPFQSALHGLPPEVLTECLVGAIEARFGSLEASGKRPAADAAPSGSPACTDCCADGTDAFASGDVKDGTPMRGARTAPGREPANFRRFIDEVWGAGVAKHFAVPYNTKLWTVPLEEMETSWLGGRVPLPNLEEMIAGAVSPVPAPVGPNARFGYPLHGGFAAMMEGFIPHLKGKVLLNEPMVALDVRTRRATFGSGRVIHYDTMVSTIPLPRLVALIGDAAPEAVRRAAAGLRHVSVKCVNIGVGRENLTRKHWIYFPEDTLFHRIFVQGNASPHNNPAGGFGLTCEITYSPTKPLPGDDDALVARCLEECIEVGLFDQDDPILTTGVVDMPYAYVIYDHARAANVAVVRQWLDTQGIVLAGRYSEWEYYNSDHAFIAGRRAATLVSERARARTA